MDVAASEGQEGPVLGGEGRTGRGDQDLSEGDLVGEDEVVLDVEELVELLLGDDAVGVLGDLGGPLGELGLDVGSEGSGLVREDVDDVGVGNEGGDTGEVLGAGLGEAVVHLVLEVLTDGGEVDLSLDAGGLQDLGVSYTGLLQEERRSERASRENDLLVGIDGVGSTGLVLDENSGGGGLSSLSPDEFLSLGVQEDAEVGAVLVGEVVRAGSIIANLKSSVQGGGVDVPADHVSTSNVLQGRDANGIVGLVQDVDEGLLDTAGLPADLERTRGTVLLRDVGDAIVNLDSCGGLESLGLLVVLEKVVPIPAVVAKTLPDVDLNVLSTGVSHAVDGAGTAESLAGTEGLGLVAAILLGSSLVGVVDVGAEGQSVTRGTGHVDIVVDRVTGLNDSDGDILQLGKTVGNDQTAGTTTDNDIVKALRRRSRISERGGRKKR